MVIKEVEKKLMLSGIEEKKNVPKGDWGYGGENGNKMMIGIVGTLLDITEGQIIRGNGKTATMTYILKNLYADEGYKVYTNYQTTFSTVYQTEDIESVLNQISKGEKKGYVIGIDEIQIFTNSYDRISKKDISFIILKLIQQSRHKNLDVFYTSQRFKDVHRRIRVQTDNYIIPKKYHLDGERCLLDRCYKDHIIVVKDFYERYNPFYFNIKEVANLYDTGEIVE